MAAISVRRAVVDDLTCIVQHYGAGDRPWDPFGDLTKLQSIPLDELVVAEVDGHYAGFLYWFVGRDPWFDPGVKKYAHIVEVQVAEHYRGQGVGKRLLVYALDQLKELAIEVVYVDTTEDNMAARCLYEGAGFRLLSRTVHYRLEREDKSRMDRDTALDKPDY